MPLKTEYKYLVFEKKPEQPAKTSAWFCLNKQTKYQLAEVKWYPAWRQYCFFPLGPSVYNDGCLKDVANFLQQLDFDRATKLQAEKEGVS